MTGLSSPQSQHGSSSTSTRTINGIPGGHTAASNGSTLPLATTAASNASPRISQQPESSPRSTATRKSGIKKDADPSETSKLLAAKISQLELDQAGEKDQEAEIDREVKRANRDLSSLLSNIESPLSRLDVVQKKYTDLLAEMRRMDREYGKSKKRAEVLQKERDVGRTELGKMVAMKEKMEKLSRELQKEKQKLKEENKRLEETEQSKREQLNERLGKMLEEVQSLGAESKVDSKSENLFKKKLRALFDENEFREKAFGHTVRKRDQRLRSNIAKLEQGKKATEQEVARSRDLRVQVATFSQTETELRSQLNVYVEKFKQVEDTLNNSNDLFLTFRKEMEDMSRKTKRLEKENLGLIRKHDGVNRNILEMVEERSQMNKEMDLLKKKNTNLEKLCRGMQAQGRGVTPAMATAPIEGVNDNENENGRTESEYEYDEDDDEDNVDDDCEDEADTVDACQGKAKSGYVAAEGVHYSPAATAVSSSKAVNGGGGGGGRTLHPGGSGSR